MEDNIIQTPEPPKNHFPIILAVVVSLILGAVGMFAYENFLVQSKPPVSSPAAKVPVVVFPSPQVLSVPAGWKTYRNTQFQFEFGYPDETSGLYGFFCDDLEMFALDKTPKIGSQCGPRDSYYTIEIKASKGEPIKEDELPSFEGAQSIKEPITINGVNGVKATFTQVKPAPIPEKWVEMLLYKDGIRYRFILSDMSFEKIFDQILSTFKFLDQLPSNTPQPAQSNGVDLKDIKYELPQGWEVKLDSGSLFISPVNDDGYLSIRVYDYSENMGRREYYCQISKVCIEGTSYFTETNVGNISGYIAQALDNSGGGIEYFGAKGNKFYIINRYYPPDPNEFGKNYENVLNSLVF